MPAWIDTKNEILNRNNDFDSVRRERIAAVEVITGHPLVIYATAFLEREKAALARGETGIDPYDPIGFDEVIHPISGDSLDVLLHSPGGSPEVAESIVKLLRSRFSHLRFIVPHIAKSAATMICCSGDEVLLDERSELGPIDPQMQLLRADKVPITAPAQAILKQFDKAKQSLAENPNQIAAWLPILQPLGPSLLTECETANRLSLLLVQDWLNNYMFHGETDAAYKAQIIADYLSDSDLHLSHGRRIGIEQLMDLGFKVFDLRSNPLLRDAIWGLYLSISWTLQETAAIKIIESCRGTAFIRQLLVQKIEVPPSPNSGQITSSGHGKRKRHK
jgi:hypothetical protein